MPESESEWFERETLERALAGDHEAGTEALKQCITGLYSGKIVEFHAILTRRGCG